MVQNPPPAGNAASTTPDKRYTALLNDSIFKGIHNAFLIGSSLVELKGRIQIAACDSLLDSLNSITFDSATSTFSLSAESTSSSTTNTPTQQPNVIDSVLNNIVLKDVA